MNSQGTLLSTLRDKLRASPLLALFVVTFAISAVSERSEATLEMVRTIQEHLLESK